MIKLPANLKCTQTQLILSHSDFANFLQNFICLIFPTIQQIWQSYIMMTRHGEKTMHAFEIAIFFKNPSTMLTAHECNVKCYVL